VRTENAGKIQASTVRVPVKKLKDYVEFVQKIFSRKVDTTRLAEQQ
jgi:hypothetical protein